MPRHGLEPAAGRANTGQGEDRSPGWRAIPGTSWGQTSSVGGSQRREGVGNPVPRRIVYEFFGRRRDFSPTYGAKLPLNLLDNLLILLRKN